QKQDVTCAMEGCPDNLLGDVVCRRRDRASHPTMLMPSHRRLSACTSARQLAPADSPQVTAVHQLGDDSRIDKACTVRVIDDAGSPSARSQPFLPASRIATSRASLFVVPSLA